jgi:myo-inositol-1(or 4)-monophosphatase
VSDRQNQADHAILVDAVRDGGAIALARFGTDQKVWRKSEFHPVCEADLEVNNLLQERLCGPRPDYGWLSEESEDNKERLKASRVWVIDPIDGTNSYLNGVPEFAIAAALVEDGQPVSAAVYNPAKEEMYEAVVGGGARLNGARIEVSGNPNAAELAMLTSRSEHREADWTKRFTNGTVKAVSSIAYKFALVAAGAFDAAASVWTKADWDICAGDLLIREAGGRVTTLKGAPLVYNGDRPKHRTCLASNALVHDGLLVKLADFAA